MLVLRHWALDMPRARCKAVNGPLRVSVEPLSTPLPAARAFELAIGAMSLRLAFIKLDKRAEASRRAEWWLPREAGGDNASAAATAAQKESVPGIDRAATTSSESPDRLEAPSRSTLPPLERSRVVGPLSKRATGSHVARVHRGRPSRPPCGVILLARGVDTRPHCLMFAGAARIPRGTAVYAPQSKTAARTIPRGSEPGG